MQARFSYKWLLTVTKQDLEILWGILGKCWYYLFIQWIRLTELVSGVKRHYWQTSSLACIAPQTHTHCVWTAYCALYITTIVNCIDRPLYARIHLLLWIQTVICLGSLLDVRHVWVMSTEIYHTNDLLASVSNTYTNTHTKFLLLINIKFSLLISLQPLYRNFFKRLESFLRWGIHK